MDITSSQSNDSTLSSHVSELGDVYPVSNVLISFVRKLNCFDVSANQVLLNPIFRLL